jgi:hypothetical protein
MKSPDNFIRAFLFLIDSLPSSMKYWFLSLLIGVWCSALGQTYSFSGELVYRTETQAAPGKTSSQELIRYRIQNEWVRVETMTPMGLQVFIRNFETGQGILLITFDGKNYALEQEMIQQSTLTYSFKKGKHKTKIAGIKARKGIISGNHLSEDIHVFYTKKIPGYFIDIYNHLIPGLPVQYTLIVKGEEVFYELIEMNRNTPPGSAFEIPEDFTRITMNEFIELMTK